MSTTTATRHQCGNEPFGCGRGFEERAFNRHVNLCHGCAATAARRLSVKVTDLSLALAAYKAAKAGHGEAEPTMAEVWAILAPAKVEKRLWAPAPNPHGPVDDQLPEGDREAA